MGWIIRLKLLRQVFEREGGKCFYCDRAVSMAARIYLSKDARLARSCMAATLDHIIPKSRGGQDSLDNSVCACFGCNTDRRDRPATDFLYERARLGTLQQ